MVVGLSWCIAGAGIVLSAATVLMFRQPALALHVLLDLLLAAGLLRLSADADWPAIAVTAAVILLRRLVTGSLLRAVRPDGVRAPRPVRH
ncbi:hypothetical protein ACN27E_08120 [Mycobacterium sp. WMMD1722]|uniref:hypothetical protein n=1 Tax=Mycobacterium sp. WMMD1722 TaxID=3404117 RepID=UPI003BF46C5C